MPGSVNRLPRKQGRDRNLISMGKNRHMIDLFTDGKLIDDTVSCIRNRCHDTCLFINLCNGISLARHLVIADTGLEVI